jgi:hypothetical protein
MNEEERELMAKIKKEDIAWETEFDLECVFCLAAIDKGEDFGVVMTDHGTWFLCQECKHG